MNSEPIIAHIHADTNNTKPVDIIDSCGVNDDYYEINDVDATNDG